MSTGRYICLYQRSRSLFDLSGSLAQLGASLTANQRVAGSSPGPGMFFRWDLVMKNISTTILTLQLILEGQLSVTGKRMGT